MIKWLFFDLGSTLIDESFCTEYRLRDLLLKGEAIHFLQFLRSLHFSYSKNKNTSVGMLENYNFNKDFHRATRSVGQGLLYSFGHRHKGSVTGC